MKKAICALCALVMVFAICVGMVACDEEGDGDGVLGEVSESQWQEALSFNFEGAENFTVTIEEGSDHSKDEAETYGEWWQGTAVGWVDKTQNAAIYSSTEEIWVDAEERDTGTIPAHFETSIMYEYYFASDGKYYCATSSQTIGDPDRDEEIVWEGEEITLAYFTERIEVVQTNVFALLSEEFSDPSMMELFTYNKETKSYESESMGITLQFLEDGGVRFVLTKRSDVFGDPGACTISDIGSTQVTIPQEAKTAVGL